ncbi:hypothetical protein AB4K05_19160 [Kluyvera sp. STS39-E]|uniref:hypothetical protein n=1 Tax=Kluyvera sp. STS39-E TaxID=3234748 RepID=UPI0034C66F21
MSKLMVAAVMVGASLLVSTMTPVQGVLQYAQIAKKRVYQGFDVTVTRIGDRVTVNGEAASKQEWNADADVFICGPYRIVFHHRTGKVRLMKDGYYLGILK